MMETREDDEPISVEVEYEFFADNEKGASDGGDG